MSLDLQGANRLTAASLLIQSCRMAIAARKIDGLRKVKA